MTRKGLNHVQAVLAAIGIASVAPVAPAMWLLLKDVPVNRLITNLTAFTKTHPKDANGFYTLGRAHSLAFTRGIDPLPAGNGSDPDGPQYSVTDDGSPQAGPRDSDGKTPTKPLNEPEKTKHLSSGITAFEKSLRLKPDAAAYSMSLAFLLEKGADRAMDVSVLPAITHAAAIDSKQHEHLESDFRDLDDAPKAKAAETHIRAHKDEALIVGWQMRKKLGPAGLSLLKELVTERWSIAIEHFYLKAFDNSLQPDLNRTSLIGDLSNLISHESGTAFLRLVANRPQTAEDKANIRKVEEGLKALKEKDFGMMITPIIFSLSASSNFASLLDHEQTTRFNLDGTSRGFLWEWVRPETGILVWDPRNTGKIESGQQLFGNATWWMLFDDGYRALDALDDNRDGDLSNAELSGIAVWFDRNSNGISDPGEVTSLESCGIVSIAARNTSTTDGCPSNPVGLRMSDGRTLPTYDWISHGQPSPENRNLATSLNR